MNTAASLAILNDLHMELANLMATVVFSAAQVRTLREAFTARIGEMSPADPSAVTEEKLAEGKISQEEHDHIVAMNAKITSLMSDGSAECDLSSEAIAAAEGKKTAPTGKLGPKQELLPTDAVLQPGQSVVGGPIYRPIYAPVEGLDSVGVGGGVPAGLRANDGATLSGREGPEALQQALAEAELDDPLECYETEVEYFLAAATGPMGATRQRSVESGLNLFLCSPNLVLNAVSPHRTPLFYPSPSLTR
jgi:hypothetical protein